MQIDEIPADSTYRAKIPEARQAAFNCRWMRITSFFVLVAPPNICDCFEMGPAWQIAGKLALNVDCFLLMDV